MLAGIAADPKPAAAQLDLQTVELEQRRDDADEVARGLGGRVGLAGGVRRGLLVMPALEGLEALLILGIDGLHGGSIAAHVGVMLLGEVLVNLLELEKLPDGPDKERRIEAISPIRQMQIPQPDFVLCCNNICNCMTKWYENIARMCNVPLIMIDIPYNNTVEVHDENVKYVRAQFDKAIKQLEELTGKKFDEKKFEQACANANRTAKAWLKVCDFLQYKPAPYSGFDLFNHMADVVTARATVAAGDAFELLAKDLEETVKKGETTTPFPEKYRVMFEGIPCWPKLPALFKPLKANGVNVTAVVYAPAFGFVYNGLDEMARAYYKAPNSVCIEQGVDWREGICRDNKVDGVLVHYNRSCKPWSGYMAEMQRRFTKDLGVPCAGFDGDQADPRNFNEAQYATRVQGLVEAMEANKKD